ncbi:MAG: 3-dehydroquinate synthase, partial [Saprospiraceae bacterium]|nr:3-dehydroquinate synthase [Saprospiraceae bacterium]
MRRISELNYDILVTQESTEIRNFIVECNASSIFVLVDENTKKFCLPLMDSVLHNLQFTIIEIPSGEQNKNLKICKYIWEKLLEGSADRKSLLINLGGGVLGDMGGFVSSSYMRGIPFIQVPTTLLAQVDASVGSKLGINFMHHKNIIGLFCDPVLNWINPVFLKTLPQRQLVNGYAEIIKHALIVSPAYWEKLKQTGHDIQYVSWEEIIIESLLIKSALVSEDKYESGKRKILNFGHTIG